MIDNGSTDDLLERIDAWANGRVSVDSSFVCSLATNKPLACITYERAVAENGGDPEQEQWLTTASVDRQLVVIRANENLGFAGGSNLGIRYGLKTGAKYLWLLNNDTVIEHDSLCKLVDFLETNPEYDGVTGQIRYYHTPDYVWNCGGMLKWYGVHRYDYSDATVALTPQQGFKRVDYITGCAALIRASFLKMHGLLTERFFHGEEDFEMALRLRKLGRIVACRYDAIIYHKVSASIKKAANKNIVGVTYIHYLNRFIDLRDFWPRPVWWLWCRLYVLYVVVMLRLRYDIGWRTLRTFSRALLRDASRFDRVDRDTFQRAMRLEFGNPHD